MHPCQRRMRRSMQRKIWQGPEVCYRPYAFSLCVQRFPDQSPGTIPLSWKRQSVSLVLILPQNKMSLFSSQRRYRDYARVPDDESTRDSISNITTEDLPEKAIRPQTASRRWLSWLNLISHAVSWTLVAALLYCNIVPRTWGWNRFEQHRLLPAQLTYSPAQTAVEYEVNVFRQGIEGEVDGVDPAFAGPPSDELDAAWSGLYNCKSPIHCGKDSSH
jgi:hypothetical protein